MRVHLYDFSIEMLKQNTLLISCIPKLKAPYVNNYFVDVSHFHENHPLKHPIESPQGFKAAF